MLTTFSFILLVALPVAAQDSSFWDDFSNNLATDLAPLVALFGEQVTKQYLSEITMPLDYFIFAMAPIGILTALVSAIRVCGSPSLRAFIGRAQEGAGNAEAELCSSTSRDVCELYNSGGIARVFGRPKILEVIYDPSEKSPNEQSQSDLHTGEQKAKKWEPKIYTFLRYVKSTSESDRKGDWEKIPRKRHRILELIKRIMNKSPWKALRFTSANLGLEKTLLVEPFAPNLSLNVGIRRRNIWLYRATAFIGLCLQSGVLIFAAVVTYYKPWDKATDRYGFPLTFAGTILVCAGTMLCAFLVGHSTKEFVFEKKKDGPTKLYWVQPGGQVIGDQTFDAFAYCDADGKDPLGQYIISQKKSGIVGSSRSQQLTVWVAVIFLVVGFVAQFVGLRATHSAISVAQLGASLVMTALRALLRTQRLDHKDNALRERADQILGHELDWLALRIGEKDIAGEPRPVEQEKKSPPEASEPAPPKTILWRFHGSCSVGDGLILFTGDGDCQKEDTGPNTAMKLLRYRSCLAELTQPNADEENPTRSARFFNPEMVEVRRTAERLCLAIESLATLIFSKESQLKTELDGVKINCAKSIHWRFTSTIFSQGLQRNTEANPITSTAQNIHLKLIRDTEGPWKLDNRSLVEGILGLWMWSLKSDPIVEDEDPQSSLRRSRATDIAARRILAARSIPVTGQGEKKGTAVNQSSKEELELWFMDKPRNAMRHAIHSECSYHEDPSTVWILNLESTQSLRHNAFEPLQSKLPRKSTPGQAADQSYVHRLFGWHASKLLQTDSDKILELWSVPQTDSLLSLCAQEVFGSFMRSMLDLVEDLGEITMVKEPPTPRLQNNLVSEIIGILVTHEICDQEAASFCVVPSVLSQFGSPPATGVLGAARRRAGTHQREKQWSRAERLLRWAWRICRKVDSSLAEAPDAPDNSRELAAIALAEFYRSNLEDDHSNALMGIILLHIDLKRNPCLGRAALDVIGRYMAVANTTSAEAAERYMDDRTKQLWRLTYTKKASLTDQELGGILIMAAQRDWVEVVLAALESSASTEFNDINGQTPLSHAARNGSLKAVEELMRRGASPNAQDKEDKSPLFYAVQSGHPRIVKRFLDELDAKSEFSSQWEVLSDAISTQDENFVRFLIESGRVNIGAVDADGQNLLHIAASNGCESIVKLLLEYPMVDRDGTDAIGRTPLWVAVEKNKREIVELLVDVGQVDANTEHIEGMTALHLAVRKDEPGLVDILLRARKIDVNAGDGFNKSTALHQAAAMGNISVVKKLLGQEETNPHLKNTDGRTPLDTAFHHEKTKVVEILRRYEQEYRKEQD